MSLYKKESPAEKEAARKAATDFGAKWTKSDSPKEIELGSLISRLALAEEREEGKVQRFAEELEAKYPGLTKNEALLWAEQIATYTFKSDEYDEFISFQEARSLAEGRQGHPRLKMIPALRKQVKKTRKEARETIRALKEAEESFRKEKIREEYKEALLNNQPVEAAFTYLDAESQGIDVGDIEAQTPTDLDLNIIHSGKLPIAGLS